MEDEKKQLDDLKKRQLLFEEFENGGYSEENILQAPLRSNMPYFFLFALFIAFTSGFCAGLGANLLGGHPPNRGSVGMGLVLGFMVGFALSTRLCNHMAPKKLKVLEDERMSTTVLGMLFGMLPGIAVGYFGIRFVLSQLGITKSDIPFITFFALVSLLGGIVVAICGVIYLYTQDKKIKENVLKSYHHWLVFKKEL